MDEQLEGHRPDTLDGPAGTTLSRQAPPAGRAEPVLVVDRLTTGFVLADGSFVPAVLSISFSLHKGETLCLVGESGSGKSLTALSLMGLVDPPGWVESGRVLLKGRDLTRLSEREWQRVRGSEIALIFQEPSAALNPVLTIGSQIEEMLIVHRQASRQTARARAVELLDAVRIPDPARRAHDYPHRLSGGLRQRAMIAMALACEPDVLIADEPTTSLDVTLQAQVLELLRDLQSRMGLALLLVTHDFGIVAEMADRVAVMYAGRIVEESPVQAIFSDPKHPYTRGLLQSMPDGTPGSPLRAIAGTVPRLDRLPSGCAFESRCPARFEPCANAQPGLTRPDVGRTVRCYLYGPAVEPDAAASGVRGGGDAP